MTMALHPSFQQNVHVMLIALHVTVVEPQNHSWTVNWWYIIKILQNNQFISLNSLQYLLSEDYWWEKSTLTSVSENQNFLPPPTPKCHILSIQDNSCTLVAFFQIFKFQLLILKRKWLIFPLHYINCFPDESKNMFCVANKSSIV